MGEAAIPKQEKASMNDPAIEDENAEQQPQQTIEAPLGGRTHEQQLEHDIRNKADEISQQAWTRRNRAIKNVTTRFVHTLMEIASIDPRDFEAPETLIEEYVLDAAMNYVEGRIATPPNGSGPIDLKIARLVLKIEAAKQV
jgi:FtsZ-interacting cell division protein YlmF